MTPGIPITTHVCYKATHSSETLQFVIHPIIFRYRSHRPVSKTALSKFPVLKIVIYSIVPHLQAVQTSSTISSSLIILHLITRSLFFIIIAKREFKCYAYVVLRGHTQSSYHQRGPTHVICSRIPSIVTQQRSTHPAKSTFFRYPLCRNSTHNAGVLM